MRLHCTSPRSTQWGRASNAFCKRMQLWLSFAPIAFRLVVSDWLQLSQSCFVSLSCLFSAADNVPGSVEKRWVIHCFACRLLCTVDDDLPGYRVYTQWRNVTTFHLLLRAIYSLSTVFRCWKQKKVATRKKITKETCEAPPTDCKVTKRADVSPWFFVCDSSNRSTSTPLFSL